MELADYNDYAEQCSEELRILQDKFQKDYDLNWYEDWFYNQVTGLLTFSTPHKELNFKYFEVGSFSAKTQTWKWAWDNNSTLKNIKERSKSIREFGYQMGFSKLTNGYFTSTEIEAWQFTAIAAKLEDGIGVYRPVSDGYLQIFMVLTDYLTTEDAQKIKDKYLECGDHDYQRTAFVCQHLNNKSRVGFKEAFETFEGMELGEDDNFQAWCDTCEIERQKEGEWNDKSMAFADIKLVCEKCYFEMKELNLG